MGSGGTYSVTRSVAVAIVLPAHSGRIQIASISSPITNRSLIEATDLRDPTLVASPSNPLRDFCGKTELINLKSRAHHPVH